jgi:hypothetical protein
MFPFRLSVSEVRGRATGAMDYREFPASLLSSAANLGGVSDSFDGKS